MPGENSRMNSRNPLSTSWTLHVFGDGGLRDEVIIIAGWENLQTLIGPVGDVLKADARVRKNCKLLLRRAGKDLEISKAEDASVEKISDLWPDCSTQGDLGIPEFWSYRNGTQLPQVEAALSAKKTLANPDWPLHRIRDIVRGVC